jgi:hypothetical protein
MYIKNSRSSFKFKAFSSYQALYLTESLVLRNRLLFIYINVVQHLTNEQTFNLHINISDI